MTLQPGVILHERYRIERQLGKGGMGVVYLALDQTTQLQVAVKENLNLNPESERQFLREARLLAGLHHPNLPRVTDYFVLEGRQYLVMDYIEGEDLHSRAARQPPTVGEILSWADVICDALAYLHSRQPPVIHRDIKPSNLKLRPDGTVVLVDFGIAKIFDQSVTTTGARGLTPGFSPPEQYGGTRTDARSDQFSLAATLYSLLAGRAPADSIERMLNHEQLKPARAYNPAVPDYVDAALTRALSIDQGERFTGVTDFLAALHGETVAPTVRARPAAAPTTRAARRGTPWLLFGGLSAAGLVILGGAVALLGGFLGGGGSPEPTATRTVAVALVRTATRTPEPPTPTPTPTPEPTATSTSSPTATIGPTPIGGGGRIAFVSDRGEERILQIWTMNPDGSDLRQLTFGPGDKTQPAWSPDGRRLLYVAPGGAGNGLDIWVMNADGGGFVNLTQFPGDDTDPAWSPDGRRVAFASTRFVDEDRVYVMNLACDPAPGTCTAGQARGLTDGIAVGHSPAWSRPDGTTLVVAASINQAPERILVRSPEGGEARYFDRSDTLRGVNDLDWSPSGGWILFTWRRPGLNEIYLVRWDDPTSFVRLTNSAGNKEAVFSPDGRFIVFTSTRDQDPEIYLMTATGADEHNLTQSPSSQDMQPAWQPRPQE